MDVAEGSIPMSSWGFAPHGLPGALAAWLAVSTLTGRVFLHMRQSDLI